MPIEELITEEFIERMKEEYGKLASTTIRYAKWIIAMYPFVSYDKERFEDVLEGVLSNVDSLNEDVFTRNQTGLKTLREKIEEYNHQTYLKITREVRDIFPNEFELNQTPFDNIIFEEDEYGLK